jgi:4-amino-4-deoxy-L-arabinose transferase-like glycosyltransferase
MIAVAIWLAVLLISFLCGLFCLRLMRLKPETPLEQVTYSTALGLGAVAYLVLLLGLAGLLSRLPVLMGLCALAVVSWGGSRLLGKGEREAAPKAPANQQKPPTKRSPSLLLILAGLTLTLFGLIGLLYCFVPPGPYEWDSLAYHLAVPKIYLEQHRISFLPTQHQSNFPFLTQMLFTLGLLFDGYALANLFHFITGVLCTAAIVAIGRRHFAPSAGLIGAVCFVTTPIVLWQASIAYIDVAQALYVTVAVGAGLEYRSSRDLRWLALCGVLMGLALAVKTLSLVPFVLIGLLLAVGRAGIRGVGVYVLCALAVGSPFYVKTWIQTGNPVYPFAYRVFGGRYWSEELSRPYSIEQRSFGLNRVLETVADDVRGARPSYEQPGFAERARNLILAPFGLLATPRIYYNYQSPGQFTHLGYLFVALPPLLLFGREVSSAGRAAALLCLLWLAAWSVTMQYVRYLIPLLPLLALLGGEGAYRIGQRQRAFTYLIGVAVAVQALLLLIYYLSPDRMAGGQARLAGALSRATDPQAREEYLNRYVNIYAAQQWINANTDPQAGVVLFEDTRGFYLDRRYLWGNRPHSLYIPYDRFHNSRQMADWFLEKGYRYAIINLSFSPYFQSAEGAARLREAVAAGLEATLIMERYRRGPTDEGWRHLLGEALSQGDAVFLPQASSRAAVVLEFRAGG